MIDPEYKANRKGTRKPFHYEALKSYMRSKWKAKLINNIEADDMLGLNQTEDTIIASIDKDLLIVSGLHYNMNSMEITKVTDEEGDRFFYAQMLMGDKVDNIIGIKGIGKVKAGKLLDATPREEWDDMIETIYEEHFGEGWYQKFVENTQLLWILNKRDMPINIRGDVNEGTSGM